MNKSTAPPEKRSPSCELGLLVTERDQTNPVKVPIRNPFPRIGEEATKVKPPSQRIVSATGASTAGCKSPAKFSKPALKRVVDEIEVRFSQQLLLSRFDERYHCYALLLALNGELTEEHCEKTTRNDLRLDMWEEGVLRRVRKFS